MPTPGTFGVPPLPATLPVFTPEGSNAGLHLLASVASASTSTESRSVTPQQDFRVPTAGLSQQGPYNPAAVLPPKVAKKVLELEFVEMSEISLDELSTNAPGQPPLPARPPVQDISVWIEKFSVMAALLASRFPEKAPELFAYQASIVRAERNFDGCRWVAYDRCYRREALALKNLNWSVPNARLYNEAFTGHAKAIPRCSYCLQEDHSAHACPRNSNRPWFGWIPDGATPPDQRPASRPTQSTECCRRYNDGRCKQTVSTCCYAHRCIECNGPHPRIHCPRTGPRTARPRSPINWPRSAQPTIPPVGGRQY